jgi:hypothetical protein
MLEFIFENNDFPEYSYYSNSNENQNSYKENISPKYRVEIDECTHRQVSININDDEPDWGYYVDLDTSTPPNKIYSKNKNNSPMTLNLPKKNYVATKPIKYLPVIEEEMYHTSNNTNNIKGYIKSEINTTSSVISGVTFCATIAFYYFFRNIRNN